MHLSPSFTVVTFPFAEGVENTNDKINGNINEKIKSTTSIEATCFVHIYKIQYNHLNN